MGWITHPEIQPRCGDDPGPVADNEQVARLIHEKILEQHGSPFRRNELFPNGTQFSNVCGDSHGCSVVRSTDLTDLQIRAMSEAQASKRPGRAARGALIAKVIDIRQIREGISPDQLAFVYDDPNEETLHAVVRGSDLADRPLQNLIITRIRDVFFRVVQQSSDEA